MQSEWCRDNKIGVFVSSKLGGQYAIVRRAIRLLLEESGMARVYLYEDEPAGSQDNVSGYLSKLDDSDVCIFLISNKDKPSVPEGVLKEHNYARQHNIPSLYLFCAEGTKKKTELQESLTTSQILKYKEIEKFADLTSEAVRSTLYDFVNVYRDYCKQRLIPAERKEETLVQPDGALKKIVVEEQQPPAAPYATPHTPLSYSPKDQMLSGFKKTIRACTDFFIPTSDSYWERQNEHNKQLKDTHPLLDALCSEFFLALIGKQALRDSFFEELKAEVKKEHDASIATVVEHRINAIAAYWRGNLKECLGFLEKAYAAAEENSAPSWMRNDLAIDLRHIDTFERELAGEVFASSPWQKVIDDEPEILHYPVIDRLESDVYERSCDTYADELTRSPYTVKYGIGYERIAESIAKAFVVAVQYGSLVHIMMTLERLSRSLQTYCGTYSGIPSMFKSMIICMLLRRDDKSLEKVFTNYYGYGGANAIDAKAAADMLQAVTLIPIDYNRNRAFFLLMRFLGYQFSDDEFAELETIIIERLHDIVEGIAMLQIANGLGAAGDLVYILSFFTTEDSSTLVSSLKSLENLLEYKAINTLDPIVQMALLQYCISLARHDKRDVRYYAATCLVAFCKTDFPEAVLQCLTEMMQTDHPEVRNRILRKLKEEDLPTSKYEYIVQQGRVDNNWAVRRTASELSNE